MMYIIAYLYSSDVCGDTADKLENKLPHRDKMLLRSVGFGGVGETEEPSKIM